MTQTVGVTSARAVLVADSAYPAAVGRLVRSAHRHCLCTVFIVDVDPAEDPDLEVDGLLHELAAAHWRGVDARLVIGGSRDNADIRDMCLAARARAASLGIPTRLVAATEQRSVHTKLVVADSVSLVGSHNWSPGAFGGQRQDSVWIDHPELAAWFVSRFEEHWSIGWEEGFDVLD